MIECLFSTEPPVLSITETGLFPMLVSVSYFCTVSARTAATITVSLGSSTDAESTCGRSITWATASPRVS